jgi:acylphosphatase
MATVHYIIGGHVQRVGFRRFALHHAHRLDLHGFTTNLEDGTVECLAQGDVSALTEFETLLRQGPQHAEVTSVVCTDLNESRKYGTFRIL